MRSETSLLREVAQHHRRLEWRGDSGRAMTRPDHDSASLEIRKTCPRRERVVELPGGLETGDLSDLRSSAPSETTR